MVKKLVGLLVVAILGGCATPAPMSFEQSLATKRATRSDVTDLDAEMRYRVGIQYANAARKYLQEPDVAMPRNTSMNFELPFAVLDFSLGNDVSGGMALASWFNSGLSQNSRYQYYYSRGLNFMAFPNTHYFRFEEGNGRPSEQEVREDWEDAFALFSKLYNREGQCRVMGYTDERQYSRTFSKDVPGEHKMTGWYCPHPVLEGRDYKVYVSTWAKPFEGVRLISMIQMQCYALGKGEHFVDVRGCGTEMANGHRTMMTVDDLKWMQITVETRQNVGTEFEVVARQNDELVKMPAPQLKQKYRAFLLSQKRE